MLKRILSAALLVILLFSFAACSTGISISTYISAMKLNNSITNVRETATMTILFTSETEPSISTSIYVQTISYYLFDDDGKYDKLISKIKTKVDNTNAPDVDLYYSSESPTQLFTLTNGNTEVTSTTSDKMLEEYANNFYSSFLKDDLIEFVITEESDYYDVSYQISEESINTYFSDFLDMINSFTGENVEDLETEISAVDVQSKIDKATKYITETNIQFTMNLIVANTELTCTINVNVKLDKINELTNANFAEPSWVTNNK